MGVYCYTFRKNTLKAIDSDTGAPVEIGIFAYAYKESFWGSGDYNRMTARAHSMAEKARDANPNVVIATFGDPKNCNLDKGGEMSLYRVCPNMTYFMDTKAPGELIGKLIKEGRKYKFIRN